jgi:DNA polymerase III alpha subunit (gram-positive type)
MYITPGGTKRTTADRNEVMADYKDVIVYTDIETGGKEIFRPIIQIAAAAYADNVQLGTFEVKLKFNPDKCDPEGLSINGYSAHPEKWEKAVEPYEACKKFSKWLRAYKCEDKVSKEGVQYQVAVLSGYNAAVFDMPRLQRIFGEHKVFLPADYRVPDVMQLAMWYFRIHHEKARPINFKLGTMCEYFGISLTNAHDALGDTIATAELSNKIMSLMRD